MRLLSILLCAAILLVGLSAYAAAPRVISFQGKLTNPSGMPMSGTFQMTFRLWNAEFGGSTYLVNVQPAVIVDAEGLYKAEITVPDSVVFDQPVWLGVEVQSNGEMTPRYRLTTSPYAFWAINSGKLQGFTITDLDIRYVKPASDWGRRGVIDSLFEGNVKLTDKYVNEGQADAITTGMIKNGEIVNADVSDTAKIVPSKILGTAWTSLNDGAGTGLDADLLDGHHGSFFVDTLTFRSDTVRDFGRYNVATDLWEGTVKLTDKYVNEGQANSITTGMIVNGDVNTVDLADTSVTTQKLATWAVTANKLAPNSVGSAKIIDGTIVDVDVAANADILPSKILGTAWTSLNDTVGSGLNADLLDLRNSGNAAGNIPISNGRLNKNLNADMVDSLHASELVQPGTDWGRYDVADSLWEGTQTLMDKYVNEGQVDAITSAMIDDSTIVDADVSPTANIAPGKILGTAWTSLNDGAGSGLSADSLDGLEPGNASGMIPISNGTLNTNLNADMLDGFHASHFTDSLKFYVDTLSDWGRKGVAANLYEGDSTLTERYINNGEPNSISTGMIQDTAVTTAKIRDRSITANKLQNDCVTTWKIINGAILNVDISDTAKIAPSKIYGTAWTSLNDGAGSGLDADMLDGFHASYFLDTLDRREDTLWDFGRYSVATALFEGTDSLTDLYVNEGQADAILTGMIKNGEIVDADVADTAKINPVKILGTAWTSLNDGPGSGLNADSLDGHESGNAVGNIPINNYTRSVGLNADYLDGWHANHFTDTTWDFGRANVAADLYEGAQTLTSKYVNEGQADAITSGMILDGDVKTGDIADGAVTNPKLAADAVTTDKILDGTVGTNDIANSAIINSKLAGSAVTSIKIFDGTIVDVDISAGAAIQPSKILGTAWTGTNDGAGSGLDADLLDGFHSTHFMDSTSDWGRSGVATDLYEGTSTLTDRYVNEGQADAILTGMIKDGEIVDADVNASAAIQPTKILGTAWTSLNDGAASGLDADLLDGMQSGNASGNIPISNGTRATNLNADYLDNFHGGNAANNYAFNNGVLNTNLNSDMLDGFHANYFVDTLNAASDTVRDFGRYNVATDLWEGTTKLTDKYVNEGQADAILTGMIKDGEVGTNDLANLAVTNAKLAGSAVTSTKIFDGTIVDVDVSASAAIQPTKILGTAWTSLNDGAASGLDADMLDGMQSGNASGNIPISNGTLNTNLNSDLLDGWHASHFMDSLTDAGRYNVVSTLYEGTQSLTNLYVNEGQADAILTGMIKDGEIVDADVSASAAIQPTKILGTAWTSLNDGAGTGLDADLLDGMQSGNASGDIPISNGTLSQNLNADMVDGLHASGLVDTSEDWGRKGVTSALFEGSDSLTDRYVNEGQADAITTGMIKDGEVNTADIADSAVTTLKLRDRAVTSAKLGLNSVSSGHIINGVIVDADVSASAAIQPTKILGTAWTSLNDGAGSGLDADLLDGFHANYFIDTLQRYNDTLWDFGRYNVATNLYEGTSTLTAKYVNEGQADAITTGMILDGEVNTNDLANQAVTTPKIATDAVTTGKILDGTVGTGDLAALAVTNGKLAADAVTTGKILDGTIVDADVSASAAIQPTKILGTAWTSLNDGAASGLDADLLDGMQSGNVSGDIPISNGTLSQNLNADMVDGLHATSIVDTTEDWGRYNVTTDLWEGTTKLTDKYVEEGQADAILTGMIKNGEIVDADISGSAAIDPSKINGTAWTSLNDGAASGLDADLLDGMQSGNASGDIPISNGTLSTNLNADMLDSFHADYFLDTLQRYDDTLWDFGRYNVATDLYEGTSTLTAKYVNEGQADAITTGMILDGEVKTGDLADLAVTTAKIAGAAVTGAKLASNSVNSAHIVNGAIVDADVSASAAIQPSKILGTAWTAANDGAGSGLDADLLDGFHATHFMDSTSDWGRPSITSALFEGSDSLADLYVNEGQTDAILTGMIKDGEIVDADVSPTADIQPSKILGTAWTSLNDGSGSGLDADMVDTKAPGNASGQIAMNNTTLNVDLNADMLDGYHANFFVDTLNMLSDTSRDWGRYNVATDLYEGTSTLTAKYVNEGQADAILTGMIKDGEVGTNDLANDAVTTLKIVNGAVTNAKLAANSVGSSNITNGAIVDADINASANIAPSKISGTAWTGTNDGAGSGLDADLLDGIQSGNASGDIPISNGTLSQNLNADMVDGMHATTIVDTTEDWGRYDVATDLYEGTSTLTSKYVNEGQADAITSSMIDDSTITDVDISATADIEPGKILGTAWTSLNDGSGSGLDADMVDTKAPGNTSGAIAVNNTVLNVDLNADMLDGYHANFFVDTLAVIGDTVRDFGRYNVATNLYEGTSTLTSKYVNEGQADAITTGMILNGEVGANDLATDAVTTTKIANLAVTTAKIANSAVTATQLASSAVTTTKIAAANVTLAKMAASSVNSSNIVDLSIVDADINAAANIAPSKINGTAWTSLNDGTGSGLDADLLDGFHATHFMDSTSDWGRSGVTSDLYEGTTKLTDKYVDEGQADAITSAMIDDSTIVNLDISPAAGIDPGKILGTAWTGLNDGAGSGLDADLLDAKQSGNASGNIPISNATLNVDLNADMLDGLHSSDFFGTSDDWGRPGVTDSLFEGSIKLTDKYVDEGQADAITTGMILNGEIVDADISASAAIDPSKILNTAWTSGNQGAGSGLDADLLDGKQSGNASGNIPVSNASLNTDLNADMLDGYHADYFVDTLDGVLLASSDWGRPGVTDSLFEGSVKLTDKYVDEGQADAITTGMILDGEVGTNDLANDAVTTGKILDLTVGTADLANLSVTNAKLAGASVNSNKIFDGSILDVDINAAAAIAPTKISGTAWTGLNDGAGSTLDADLLDGMQSGNASGDIPISNGTLNTNLNADMLDGNHWAALMDTLSDWGRKGVSAVLFEGSDSLGAKYVNEGQADAIVTGMIKDGEVGTNDLANLAVTTGKIADAAVDSFKIANGAVTTARILDNAVTTAKILNTAIITAKIANANVTLAKMAASSVNSSNIVDLSIVDGDINAAAAIAPSKISGTAWTSTNDGALSGLDADLLDGFHAAYFMDTLSDWGRKGVTTALYEGSDSLAAKYVKQGQADAITTGMIKNGEIIDADISGSAAIAPSKISGTAWTGSNDGAGSTLDADLLDGLQSGNASGDIPISNGTLNTNLNADMVDGLHQGDFFGMTPRAESLVASIANPNAVLYIQNTGNGRGLFVGAVAPADAAVFDGDIRVVNHSAYIELNAYVADSIYVGGTSNNPTSKLDVVGDNIRIRDARTPSSSTDTLGTYIGQISWDNDYVYIRTGGGAGWKRAALSTW